MIDLSTKGRYATRILVCMAAHELGTPVRKRDIAEQEGLSPDYTEQILLKLRAHGLVHSTRGARGGFVMARAAHTITVKDVVEATEGPIMLAPCLTEACARDTECVTRGVWRKAQRALEDVLASVTIGDLVEEAWSRKASSSPSYAI